MFLFFCMLLEHVVLIPPDPQMPRWFLGILEVFLFCCGHLSDGGVTGPWGTREPRYGSVFQEWLRGLFP